MSPSPSSAEASQPSWRPHPDYPKLQRLAAMRAEDWKAIQNRGEEALTQALGRACWQAGIEGILVPSAPSPKGVNAVFFPDRLLDTSALTPRPDADLLQRGEP